MEPPAPRRAALALALAAALALTAGLSGCGGTGDDSAAPTPTAQRPSPRTTSDTEICTQLVSHWAKETLVGGKNAGADFMQKGLSNGQNEILLAAVAAAETERKRHGLGAARKLIDRQVKQKCTERYRHGKPTEGGWG